MSRTYKHKINAKFKNNIISIDDVPVSMLKYWNRKNFEIGYFRKLRNEKKQSQYEIEEYKVNKLFTK